MTDKEETQEESKVTAGTLREWIKQEISALVPGKSTKDEGSPSTGDSGGGAPSIAAQVKAALQQLEHKKTQEERDKQVDEMLKKYNEPPQEQPPVERRRVERWMRWGDDSDKK